MTNAEIIEIRQERSNLLEQAKAMNTMSTSRNKDFTAEEQTRYNGIIAKMDMLSKDVNDGIDSKLGLDEMENRLNYLGEPVAGRVPVEAMPQRYDPNKLFAKNESIVSNRYSLPNSIKASDLDFGRWFKGMVTNNWEGASAEFQASQNSGTDTGGGYLVPAPLSERVIDLARNQARTIQAGAMTVPMTSSSLTMANVTQDPTASWTAENATAAESDMAFGAIKMYAHTLVCLVRISIELIEDASNLSAVLNNAMAQALALELDRAALFGDGVGNPLGLSSTLDVQSIDMGANGAALTNYAKFSNAWQKIQEVNGPDSGLSAIMNPREAGAIDLLVDANLNPLAPPQSWSKINKFSTNQIPIDLTHGTATNASTVIMGDYSNLIFGMRTNQLGIEFSRSAGTAFEKLQVLARVYLRADTAVIRPNHFVKIEGIIPA